ncbi:MAG: hypothetical protein C4B59_08765 [Candidatus Methanogaster sp.]|uniref:Uncharacterized protein n=1 Tax=Candidatus Methanogaster sp. TaxID=3386292 RepID=A0AC61L1U7_9EURY|nr:MAG: hypothetical protein C4B59_08765 [ANME-2 cluster archaeon]
MNNNMKMGLFKVITLFSILIALSGMAAIASADEEMPIVNIFRGNVTLNGADAPLETVVNAYIDEELRGSHTIESGGKYYIAVVGNGSVDGDKVITFTVCGAAADQSDIEWHASYQSRLLDLTAVDDEAPAVTNATATLSSIVADGVETTKLNVTVIDGCGVGTVTVDLSDIGGSAVQTMTRIEGTDVYSATVTADANTAPGAYCLYVNASDVFGNCNTSVCIDLVIKDVEAPVVSNPDADPESIVADGTETSQLSVTVVDDSDIDFVTVDLSDIGGDAAQEMSRIGDTDVYSVTVTVDANTLPGAYCLYVNASDVFGNYEDGVCIDLEIEDVEAPVVSNPDADPASIVADGTETSQLSVTVVDDSDIDFVTVDLSAIGGSAVQVIESSGGDTYSTDTNASVDTLPGTYCLQVNASDVFGNYDDTSVCIGLEVTEAPTSEYDSADTNQDCVVSMPELMTQIGKWKLQEIGMPELMTSIGRWKLGSGGYC